MCTWITIAAWKCSSCGVRVEHCGTWRHLCEDSKACIPANSPWLKPPNRQLKINIPTLTRTDIRIELLGPERYLVFQIGKLLSNAAVNPPHWIALTCALAMAQFSLKSNLVAESRPSGSFKNLR